MIYKKYTIMNSTKGAHEQQKESREPARGGWKKRASDGLPMIHASTTLLWSATGIIHKLQPLKSEHAGPGLLEATQQVQNEAMRRV